MSPAQFQLPLKYLHTNDSARRVSDEYSLTMSVALMNQKLVRMYLNYLKVIITYQKDQDFFSGLNIQHFIHKNTRSTPVLFGAG